MNATNWTYSLEDHENQQLLRSASWSFSQKLQWLEDAHRMMLQIEKTRAATASNNHASNARTSSARMKDETDPAAKTQL